MRPVKRNLECWQGKTFEQIYLFKDVDENAIDMSGWTARMQVRVTIDASTYLVELTTENDGIIIDGPAGSVTLFIDDVTTSSFPPGSYKYDLELETPLEKVYGPLYGSFKVKAEVTRSA
jgi:hypothetical protein